MSLNIEAGKMYLTADEHLVKVYAVYETRIHGAIMFGDEEWDIALWDKDGHYIDQMTFSYNDENFDIAKERLANEY